MMNMEFKRKLTIPADLKKEYPVTEEMRRSAIDVLSTQEKPRDIDIAEADVIVAVGRGASGKAARASARLFLIPGMGHCYGGAGCDTFDKLAIIDNWVEHGVAPQRIVASKIEDGKVVRTRPLCAWPQVARYAGKGDIDNADSYACVDVTQ